MREPARARARRAARTRGRARACRRRSRRARRAGAGAGRPRRASRPVARGTSTRTCSRSHGEPGRGGELGEPGAPVPAAPVHGGVVRPAERRRTQARPAAPRRRGRSTRASSRSGGRVVGHGVEHGEARRPRRSAVGERAAPRRWRCTGRRRRAGGPGRTRARRGRGRRRRRRRARPATRRCRRGRSRRRGCGVARCSHGASRSAASARVLRYHQWSSSTAAMRAYSSTSTRRGYRARCASALGDAQRVDDEVGRRPRLHADAVTGRRPRGPGRPTPA